MLRYVIYPALCTLVVQFVIWRFGPAVAARLHGAHIHTQTKIAMTQDTALYRLTKLRMRWMALGFVGRRPSPLRLLGNLLTDTLIVVAWPFILIYPVALVGAFGNPPQLFLGPFPGDVGKLVAPFMVATVVMGVCAGFINVSTFKSGSSSRALSGWELIPPACFIAAIPAMVILTLVADLLRGLFAVFSVSASGLDVTRGMPLSPLMIWGAALTPPALLSLFEIVGVDPSRRPRLAWVAGAAALAVFAILIFFS